MGELIPFPQTPPEPIPPHQPEPGEEPPENVIFPDKFQQKTEEEEKGIQLLPEDGKELARKEAAEFWIFGAKFYKEPAASLKPPRQMVGITTTRTAIGQWTSPKLIRKKIMREL